MDSADLPQPTTVRVRPLFEFDSASRVPFILSESPSICAFDKDMLEGSGSKYLDPENLG